jgi:hypothetical protein
MSLLESALSLGGSLSRSVDLETGEVLAPADFGHGQAVFCNEKRAHFNVENEPTFEIGRLKLTSKTSPF